MKNLIVFLVAIACSSLAHSACLSGDLSVLGQSNQQMLGEIVSSIETTETLKVGFSGTITKSSIDRLIRRLNDKIEDSDADYKEIIVSISSTGGDINQAARAVRVMRELSSRPDVVIHTKVLSRSYCESACTILYTGGEKRFASKRTKFGFHSPKYQNGDIGDRTPEQIEEVFRTRWLSYISYVDQTAASTVASKRYLYDDDMSYMTGEELETGYVTDRL